MIQMDILFGNPKGNLDKAIPLIEQAAREGSRVVLLPELWTTGYSYQNLRALAESLGGKTRHVLLWVLIPLSTVDLLGGFSLTWARAMGEVAATLIFAGAIQWKTEIFPVVVLTTSQSDPPLALAASLIAAVLSIVALLMFKWVVGRRR